jgi:hypothetical protein
MYTEDVAVNLILASRHRMVSNAPVSAVPKAPVERKVAVPKITDEMIEEFLSQSVAPATAKLKASIMKKFESVMREQGISKSPFDGKKIIIFMNVLLRESKTFETIIKYANEVILHHSRAGIKTSPADKELIRQATKACERMIGRKLETRAATLSKAQLGLIARVEMSINDPTPTMFLVGVAALLRLSELVELRYEDITFKSVNCCEIMIRKSKTDQGRKGSVVHMGCVSENPSKCREQVCPLHRLKTFVNSPRIGSTKIFGFTYAEAAKKIGKLVELVIDKNQVKCSPHFPTFPLHSSFKC